MSNNRDTQFAGFAKALFGELQAIELEGLKNSWNNLDVYRRQREAIARRAYDFAFYTIDNSRSNDMEDWETDAIMPYVPDMPELPKEQEESNELAAMAWGLANAHQACIQDLQRQVSLLHDEVFCTNTNRPATTNRTLLGSVRHLYQLVYSLQGEEPKEQE